MILSLGSCSQKGAAANTSMLLLAAVVPGRCSTSKEKAEAEKQLSILVVEDDPINALAVSKLLEKCGHQVHTAHNGQEAIELAKVRAFDFIFMDIEMPVMDGLQATKIIRSASDWPCPAHIPIVAMTGHSMNGNKEQFLQAGMDAVLSKPFYVKELQSVIASFIS
ncbi:hypothetical protein MASR1M90_24100 [Desulfovibrionales bacterium]